MNLLVRWITRSDSPPPGAGEIYILPESNKAPKRRDFATLVFKQGLKCLPHGTDPIQTIVVDGDPTLDDVLAAIFAAELLAGRPLPAGAEQFASYSALVREGHIPSKLPLETSLEGLYLAIRTADGGDLTKADIAAQFADRCRLLGELVLNAARDGINPFVKPLIAEGSEFAREQMYLARDHETFMQDVERGEQWDVALPGGPLRGRALLLREPKSRLFKQRSRREEYSGIGKAFVFLAVDHGNGEWVFSTDPVSEIRIDSLAARLQAAETELDPDSAAKDPWFDGKPFGYTLVAAPHRGTKLPQEKLLQIVHDWSDAPTEPVFAVELVHRRGPQQIDGRWVAAAAAVACLLALAGWRFISLRASKDVYRGYIDASEVTADSAEHHDNNRHGDDPKPRPEVPAARGLEYDEVSSDSIHDTLPARTGSDYALFIATDNYKNWRILRNAKKDVDSIAELLETHYGFRKDHVELWEEKPRDEIRGKFNEYLARKFGPDDQLLIYISGHGEHVGPTGYLVARDSLKPPTLKQAGDGAITGSYFSLADVREAVQNIHRQGCGHVLLVMDTCFGGLIDFNEATLEPSKKGASHIKPTLERKAEIVRRKMQHPCCLFLTSVGPNDTASDGAAENSPFAADLIGLLKDPGPGGLITFPRIVDELTYSNQEPRSGSLCDRESSGDFVFAWQK